MEKTTPVNDFVVSFTDGEPRGVPREVYMGD